MRFYALIAIVSTLAGCASSMQPRAGENGEKLVFVKSIKGVWLPDGGGALAGQAVSGPLAGGANPVAAGAVGGVVGLLVQAIRGPEVLVEVNDYGTGKRPSGASLVSGKTLQRKPWPGIERLAPGTWAILSTDEDGEIVIACPSECQPIH